MKVDSVVRTDLIRAWAELRLRSSTSSLPMMRALAEAIETGSTRQQEHDSASILATSGKVTCRWTWPSEEEADLWLDNRSDNVVRVQAETLRFLEKLRSGIEPTSRFAPPQLEVRSGDKRRILSLPVKRRAVPWAVSLDGSLQVLDAAENPRRNGSWQALLWVPRKRVDVEPVWDARVLWYD